MVRVHGSTVNQRECRSSSAKLSWLEASKCKQMVCWSGTHSDSAELGISQSTVQRILHKYLAFQSHKIMPVQQLNPRDYQQRLSFCQTMLDMFEENKDLTLIMSDEAHFYINGTVNKQNFQYWASENPRELHQRSLHSPKVTVWCGLGKCGIFGHSFSKKEKRQQRLLQTAIFECLKTVFFLSFADEESIGHQCGFNKMGTLLIQRERP